MQISDARSQLAVPNRLRQFKQYPPMGSGTLEACDRKTQRKEKSLTIAVSLAICQFAIPKLLGNIEDVWTKPDSDAWQY